MTTITSRGLAVLLALALVALTLPAAPTAANDADEDCDAHGGDDERGWIAVSHPGTTQNLRASQTLYLQLYEGLGLGLPVEQSWTNGIDAYVIDMECIPTASHDFCVERLDPLDDRNGFVGIPILQTQDEDYRVAFYGSGPGFEQLGDHDVDALEEFDRGEDECPGDAPDGAQYAVVYLASGTVSGIQIDEQIFGPYTEHFRFHLVGPLE